MQNKIPKVGVFFKIVPLSPRPDKVRYVFNMDITFHVTVKKNAKLKQLKGRRKVLFWLSVWG